MAKSGMATDSRGYAPGTTLQIDIPSGRLITGRVDDPLEFRGAPEISVDRGFKSLRPHFCNAHNPASDASRSLASP